jgi:hypothetical protein
MPLMKQNDAAICARVLIRMQQIVDRSRDHLGLITRDGMEVSRMMRRLEAAMFGVGYSTLLDEGRWEKEAA